ncbi:hypothetical protein ACFW04_004202 [Cataglyphis niger]
MPPQEKLSAANGRVLGDLSSKDTSPESGLSASASSETGFPAAKSDRKSGDQEDDPEQPKDLDFDDLLPHVGEFGTYQRILFVLMIPFAFFVAWVYFSQIFITLVPEKHWCRVPELENLTVEERMALAIPVDGDGYSKCTMYDVNYTEIILNEIREADPSWPTKGCSHGWEFNFSDIPYETVATELGWVCEHSALPTAAQSVFFVGAIFGGLLFGWIADRYGRIPALVGANVTGFLAGVATVLADSFWKFALCRFFVGFAFDNCFTMMYILVLEYVGPKWRTFVANMSIALFFTFAACILPWIAYFLANWRMTCIAISVPLVLAVAAPWLVPESARWLVSQGQVEKAIEILGKFERMNGTKVPDNVYQQFRSATLAIVGRFWVNISYNIGLQYAAEVLPTVVRAQGVALIHIMGYVASILAPFVVYLDIVSSVLPLLVLGIMGILGGLLTLLLPETLDKDLPQTLQDGEDFGKDQKIWDMPFLSK